MNLKLSSVGAARRLTKRVDPYVPFDVDLLGGVVSVDDLFYWRATDARALLEVRILASTGALAAITLVLVPREWTQLVDSVKRGCPVSHEGQPQFDVTPWKDRLGGREIGVDPSLRRIDEAHQFLFAIGRDGIALTLDAGTPVSSVTNGDLTLQFTADEKFCGVTLGGLSSEDLKMLRESFAGPT